MDRDQQSDGKSGKADQPPREPEPSWGPDEEGELPLAPDHIPGKDSGAWVKRRGK